MLKLLEDFAPGPHWRTPVPQKLLPCPPSANPKYATGPSPPAVGPWRDVTSSSKVRGTAPARRFPCILFPVASSAQETKSSIEDNRAFWSCIFIRPSRQQE